MVLIYHGSKLCPGQVKPLIQGSTLKAPLRLLLVLKVASRALPQGHSGIFFSRIIYLAYYFLYTQYHPIRVTTVYKTLTTQYKLA